MYCIDAQNNTRSVAPDYVALDGEILCAELPGAVLQSVASIEAKAALMAQAQAALSRSDVQVLRCYEAGVPFPPRWAAYRQILRDIGSGKRPGPVPEHPDWPGAD
jgi:hypothetical protein